MNWQELLSADPAICHGKVCVKGTRIPASVVLDNLAQGVSTEEILKSYPSLTEAGIKAVLAYAADLAHERVLQVSA